MGTGPDVRALLGDVAEVGPFFAVATGAAPVGGTGDDRDDRDDWVALRVLALPADPVRRDPLRARISALRAALGTDDRVAASTAFQGLAAQVVAPLFAAVVLHGALPVPDGPATAGGDHETPGGPDRGIATALRWRPGGAGPWLWWAGGGRVVPCPDAALGDVVVGLLAPLVTAVRARTSVSARVLWGDAASAVASARRLVTAARPAATDRATAVAGLLLAAPPLAPTVTLRPPEPPDAAWTFRRRSCCLYYRVPGGAPCGDCVLLDRRPRTRGGPDTAGRARPRLA